MDEFLSDLRNLGTAPAEEATLAKIKQLIGEAEEIQTGQRESVIHYLKQAEAEAANNSSYCRTVAQSVGNARQALRQPPQPKP